MSFRIAQDIVSSKVTEPLLKLLLKEQFKDQELVDEFGKLTLDSFNRIDNHGNTIFHYHALGYLKLAAVPCVADLDQHFNKDVMTALDILLSSKNCQENILELVNIASVKDLKLWEAAYDKTFGARAFESSFLEHFGGKLLCSAKSTLVTEVVKYLLTVKKLSAS